MNAPVVIVGAGLAGLATALELAPVPCVVLTTGELGGEAASALAQGGIAAALGDDDSPALHAMDTMAAGAGLSRLDVVESITSAAPEAISWLVRLGARFDRRDDGSLALGLEGAHSRNRIVHAGGDGSGREVLRAVAEAVRATPSVTVLEHTRAVRLVSTGAGSARRVTGVVVENSVGENASRRVLPAAAVVLATGGVGGMYASTTNPRGARGQGVAMAMRVGAEVRDLEMVQFHPTALDVGLDPMPLVSEAVRGEGAVLVTASGERVIENPLAPRDVVSRAVFAAEQRGEQVYLDARAALGRRFSEEFPAIAEFCAAAGIDPARELIPVTPAAHYHMGGVAVDLRGRTIVPGLWAVGEVASTGLHGANRLASNSLLEAVVCGRRAGADIAEAVAGVEVSPVLVGAAWTRPAAVLGTEALQTLRENMSRVVGVLRDRASLAEFVTVLEARVQAAGVDEIDDATLVALGIARGALARRESVGAHVRVDAPTPTFSESASLPGTQTPDVMSEVA